MNQEKNEERIDLDRMLAEMAQETPEMPADFHARWTEAVRAEAGQAKTEKKQDSPRQWRYILSAAAVFVFLIGGTLLTRGMDQKDGRSNTAVTVNTAAPSMAPQPAAAAAAGTSLQGTEADTAGEADLFMAMNEAAVKTEEDSAAAADASEKLAVMLSANSEKKAGAAAREAPAAEPETAPEAEEEETAAEDAGIFMEEAVPETAAEPEAAPEETAEPAQESGFVSFLKDLGAFTLKTLAVAVPAAALAFGVAAVHKALKKRKKP